MELVKYKVVYYLLDINLAIGKKLLILSSKYEADKYAEKHNKFDLRSIPERIKNILIHDSSIVEKRLAECLTCEHYIKATSQCKKCGCFMELKSRLATASCPVGKWDKEYDFIKGKNVPQPAR